MKFYIHKKEQEGLLHVHVYENGAGEKIVRHSKLKLRTFFWGHGEQEWPSLNNSPVSYILIISNVPCTLFNYNHGARGGTEIIIIIINRW